MEDKKQERNNSGALFRLEEEKRKKPNSPTHSGTCTVDNKKYWISAWVAKKDNIKYFSLSFTTREELPAIAEDHDVLDDDIPF